MEAVEGARQRREQCARRVMRGASVLMFALRPSHLVLRLARLPHSIALPHRLKPPRNIVAFRATWRQLVHPHDILTQMRSLQAGQDCGSAHHGATGGPTPDPTFRRVD